MSQDLIQIGMFGVMAAALYFILIRPQQQRQKQHAEMLGSLVVGDRVATAGGLIGTLRKIGDDEVTVEIANGVQVRLVKEAVSSKIEE